MANPTAIPRTYRRGFRRKVSVIRCYPTTFASLDQESFRIIDNTPIYGDFGPNRSPRCTFGNFVQGLGVDTSEEQVIFPIGLTQKVAELLRACGRWPAIRPNQKVEYATKHLTPDSPGFMCPAPLRRTYGRLYSLLQLPHQDDRFRVIAGLRQQFPDVHQLVVVRNKAEAEFVAQHLRKLTGKDVTVGSDTRWGDPWWHVVPLYNFENASVLDWAVIVFWDAELAKSETAFVQLLLMSESVRIGFTARDLHYLNDFDRAQIESVFGPVIYRPSDRLQLEDAVAVAWLSPPTYPAEVGSCPLERKQRNLWHNTSRNQLIAEAARALKTGDITVLAKLGLEHSASWLYTGDPGRPASPSRTICIAVIVENPAHGHELCKLLQGWELITDYDIAPPEVLLEGDVIVTLAAAARMTILADVVIYAAGTGNAWFDELGVAVPTVTPERMLVVDIADDFDDQATSERRSRQADYERRRWYAKEPS